jgi:hypothetical protein
MFDVLKTYGHALLSVGFAFRKKFLVLSRHVMQCSAYHITPRQTKNFGDVQF